MIAGALAVALLVPQGGEPLFRVGEGDPPVISADRRAVTARDALVGLATAMEWNLIFQPETLRNDLGIVDVDLAFEDQDPRLIAQLVAAAAGVDVVFDVPAVEEQRPTLHVVPVPDAFTEEGRQRLRDRASQWYENFLVDELQRDPSLEEDAMRVRMHLGRIRRERGDLEAAIRFYKQVYDTDRTHDATITAMLRMAECHYELGDYELAEEWGRRVASKSGMPPEVPRAIVLLGRVLIAQERYRECIGLLEAKALALSGRPAMVDLHLLMARAWRHLDRPEEVFRKTEALADVLATWQELDREQWLDYHFLRGYGAQGTGETLAAVQALEWFLIRAEDDPRRGQAFVLLGKAYLEAEMFLEARAAALEAHGKYLTSMDGYWRREARKLNARAALVLGDEEEAFRELEREVRRSLDPELTLFLVDEYLAANRWQKAINAAKLLIAGSGRHDDAARFKTVVALYEQSLQVGSWRGFPEDVRRIVLEMEDVEMRRKVMEMLAHAYEEMGELEKAADAIRGVLR